MSTPEQPKIDECTAIAMLVANEVPSKQAVELVRQQEQHMVDVAPLLRGDVKGIRIPVFKAKPGLNIEVYEAELRVVEEVEFKGNGYDCLLKCDGCGWSIGWHIKEDLQPMLCCPGCGNKIKA